MKSKRVGLRLVMAGLLAVSLSACGNDSDDDNNSSTTPPPDTTPTVTEDMADDLSPGEDMPDTEVDSPPDTPDDMGPDADRPEPDMGDDAGGADDDMAGDDMAEDLGPDPCTLDDDFDLLTNCQEAQVGTDPNNTDTDGDGLSDYDELQEGTNPLVPDSDGDGLSDGAEIDFRFDPNNPSTNNDSVLDGDRWIVTACENPASEPVGYNDNALGDWKIGLPPAFTDYTNLTITGADPTNKWASATFSDPANEVASFVLTQAIPAGVTSPVDAITSYRSQVGASGRIDQDFVGGEFETHDFNTAATGRYKIIASGGKSALQVRDELLFALAPFGSADVTGLPPSAGATYTRFRVFLSVILRVSQSTGPDRLVISVAVAPDSLYDSRDAVKFRMDDLTNTTNIAQAPDGEKVDCRPFRALEGNPEADFYFITDQSGSMNSFYNQVRSVANQFFFELTNTALDYRLGVTSMDEDFNGRLRASIGWHKDLATFIGEIDEVETGSYDCCAEWGLKVAKEGIQYMRSAAAPQNIKVRSAAQLITVFMSDEETEDLQRGCPSTQNGSCAYSPSGRATIQNEYISFFQGQTIAFAIVGDGNGCGSSDGEAYRQVALATGGATASLCATDVSETIQNIIFAATGLASNYQLGETPISSTLRVYQNGIWVPRSRENGFDYFASTNSIAFFGSYRPVAADPTMGIFGDDIAVSYQTFIDRSK